MKNKIEIKDFLGSDIRVVNGEYVPLNDVFKALGKLTKEGKAHSHDRKKIKDLQDLEIISEGEKLSLSTASNKRYARSEQDETCVKLQDIPLILTQFKPSSSAGEVALYSWVAFMKFVNELLKNLELSKFIVTDKKLQVDEMDRLSDVDGSPVIANKQVNTIMAKLVEVYDKGIKSLKKDDLRYYQDQTTVDLLEVRQFVMDKFVNAYEFTHSHKEAAAMAYKLAYDTYFKQLVA